MSTVHPDPNEYRLATKAIHAGVPKPRIGGSAVVPIFQCSVFEQGGEDSYHDLIYPRLNNLPNHRALGEKLAALESAEAALVTASGMAAITTTLLAVLRDGGHALVQETVYGGTHTFVTDELSALGMSYDFIDATDTSLWEGRLRLNTRAIYVEGISNPTMKVAELGEVVRFAKEHELLSIIDNTFATPFNFRPLPFGFDICLHSATKYLNGHSDLAAGVVAGSEEWVGKILHLLNHLGGSMDAHACYLLDRGLRTLTVRVAQQNANALALATFLDKRPEVANVNYPGLETHPQYALANELFSGFGGMLSFEMAGGVAAAEQMIAGLRLPIHGPSLGGVETLITRPATSSHLGMSAEDRLRLGIPDGLIRVSVGIEAIEDLIADFSRALRS